MDVNILDPIKALDVVNYSEMLGRFVGFFTTSLDNKPSFILLGRSDPPNPQIDRVFLFHVNSASHYLEPSDQAFLLNKILNGVIWRKMNILTDMQFAELTILFTVVEREIHACSKANGWLMSSEWTSIDQQ